MNKYVVGVDGGGTKTALQARDPDGNICLAAVTGGLNFNSLTRKGLETSLDELVSEISKLPGGLGSCGLLCIAAAGISNPQAADFFESSLRNAGFKCELVMVGDHEGALYGALKKPSGMVLISGTGSICYGKNEAGKTSRAGGWGHIIDDEGSGYAIGRDILAAAVQSYDGRKKKSILYGKVLEQIGGKTVEDIIKYTYCSPTGKKDIASLAPLLTDAIGMGDPQAITIGNKAAAALVRLVLPVARELGLEEGELALSGGFLIHNEYLRGKVIDKLKQSLPELSVHMAIHDNVTGVTLMALELFKKRREDI